MRNQIHELSIDDLEEVSGGNGPSIPPFIYHDWDYPRAPEGPVDIQIPPINGGHFGPISF